MTQLFQPTRPARPFAQSRLDTERRWWQAAEAALTLAEPDLVRALAAAMREGRSNHLDALYYQSRLALVDGDQNRAQPLLERVLRRDPEHWPARWSYGALHLQRGERAIGLPFCREAVRCGDDELAFNQRSVDEQRTWEVALERVEAAFPAPAAATEEEEESPLARALRAVLLLESWWGQGQNGRAARLARELVDTFPHLIKPRLLLAEWLAATGHHEEAAHHLALIRADDPGGRVARRLGFPALSNAYAAPLPEGVPALLDTLPVAIGHAVEEGAVWQAPAAIALPRPVMKRKPTAAEPSPELLSIRRELDRIQLDIERHMPASSTQALATAEAIIVARQPLLRLYGQSVADAILRELATLGGTVTASGHAQAHLLVVDEAESMAAWDLKPLEQINAATVKQALDQFDEQLGARGQRLAYVLLIGGHGIIPHHRLPNPVDDYDLDVPSDNPYAARDDNYLIPSRAVGRLPHERHSPALLLGQIRRLQQGWRAQTMANKGRDSWLSGLFQWIPRASALPPGESFGCSAEVWQEAASAVFRTLDSQAPLLLSPPTRVDGWAEVALPTLPFYYFNLHGVEENGSWFGQVGPAAGESEDPFPEALTPEQFATLSLERSVIFSEACYGVKPHATRASDAIALTAMRQGCSLYIGSTNTSYASFRPPLLAADLLAALFWKAIAEGAPGGVALQKAKIQLAESSMRRAGYLDVEEQKTLTSFVLYGDPAFPLLHRPQHSDPQALQALAAKTAHDTLYQISTKGIPTEPPEPAITRAVQQFAAPYLQGTRRSLSLRAHSLSITDAAPRLNDRRRVPRAKRVPRTRDRWHVTVTSSDEAGGVTHRQVLTMMMDKGGRVLRSHVSR